MAAEISSLTYEVHFLLTQTFKSHFVETLAYKEQSCFVSIWTRKKSYSFFIRQVSNAVYSVFPMPVIPGGCPLHI
jgi:hypothetical protein